MIILRALPILMLAMATNAHAGFFAEPMVGYTAGALSQAGVPAVSSQAFILGGRLGYRWNKVNFGADYSMGFGTGSQFGNKGEYRPTDIGAFLGYALPLNLNVYGSYFVVSKAKIQPNENPAGFSGQSFRAGLGWSGLGICSIHFEGIYRIYSKYGGSSMNKALRGMTLGASVSIPFPRSRKASSASTAK